jgi:uncharacterized protein involved in high-affinity Fe2+ transport
MRGFVAVTLSIVTVGIGSLGFAPAASAKEYPIGKPQIVSPAGMEVAAVYLQPVEMEPAGMMRAAKDSDVHLEADIKATKGNKNGYAEGDWIGYLKVDYELTKVGGAKPLKGEFMAMVANDGRTTAITSAARAAGTSLSRSRLGRKQARISDATSTRKPALGWFKTFSVSTNSPSREPGRRVPNGGSGSLEVPPMDVAVEVESWIYRAVRCWSAGGRAAFGAARQRGRSPSQRRMRAAAECRRSAAQIGNIGKTPAEFESREPQGKAGARRKS